MIPVADIETGQQELFVLLDERHQPIGTARKREVHTDRTPLHLAFSRYLFDSAGRVLMTRRALGKRDLAGQVDQLVLRPSRSR
jgi:isopentenyl-diphosphate delta-isomerase